MPLAVHVAGANVLHQYKTGMDEDVAQLEHTYGGAWPPWDDTV
jgi:hypothetical protein